jgi:prepilin-type N-terminal cleavage/methylation domain-containing protein
MFENDKEEERMMKPVRESTLLHDQGFSLIELVIVVAIMSALLAIAGIYSKQWLDKYKAESQIRTMHTDLLQARAKAMEKSKQYFVVVNNNSYQVIEDTNETGAPDAGDTYQTLNTLKYQVSTGGTGTITMDQKGIISAGTTTEGVLLVIKFDTGSGTPEYNCMQLCATRIAIGRMNGTICDPR